MTARDAEPGYPATSPWDMGDVVKAMAFSLMVITVGAFALLAAAKFLQLKGVPTALLRVSITVGQAVLQNLAFVVSVWLCGLRKYRVGINSLGLRPFRIGMGCGSAAIAFIVALGFNVSYRIVVMVSTGRQVQATPILPLFGGGLTGLALAIVVGSLLVPLVEETFFRGFIFPGLARRFGITAGMILSAGLFGAAHLNLDTFIPLSFFGLVLTLLYSVTGSIYPGIILHSVNNSFALLVAYLIETGFAPSP